MKVRPRKYASGATGWQVDYGLVDGKRKQVSFETKKEAGAELARALAARKRHGELGQGMGSREIAEYVTARERLGGVSLMTAVEFYLAKVVHVKEPMGMVALIERYLDAKPERGFTRKSRVNVTASLNSLALSVAPKMAHEVERADVERWLGGNGWQAKTKNNYLGDARTLFKWALSRGHVAANPTDGVERMELGDAEIEILTVDESEALLQAAWSHPRRLLLGFVVLGLLCGVRPDEIARLTWDAVDVEERTIVVAGPKSKTRRRRVVDMPENAAAWLAGCRRVAGEKIVSTWFHDSWRCLREKCGWSASGRAGLRPWPHDAMRHTFASMHYAAHQDESLLQAQMGHESDEMLHRHYRAMVTRAEAAKFWDLRPGKLRG